MLYESTCLGHQKWRQMHYLANALIRWHFGYESSGRCNDWIPKSNRFRTKKLHFSCIKNYTELKNHHFFTNPTNLTVLKILEFQ